MRRIVILASLLSLAAFGCERTATQPNDATPPAAPTTAAAATPAAAPATLEGKVLETLDSGGYTYLRLETANGETWAAVDKSKVEVGSSVTISHPTVMDGFESPTLKRHFDHIVFGQLVPAGGAVPTMVHPPASTVPDEAIQVAKAGGDDGATVAEVFSRRKELAGHQVAVRGKVVKYNPGILGKNWIHLRDGSGTTEGKDDDLTVTTTADAQVGDVILITGTVQLDKDFGAGYRYPVIVEDAKIEK